jgi:hypothetical protein
MKPDLTTEGCGSVTERLRDMVVVVDDASQQTSRVVVRSEVCVAIPRHNMPEQLDEMW